jgi:hypothetical protein
MITTAQWRLGNAQIEGLMEDLNLTGKQYNIAVSVFFIGYVTLGMKAHCAFKWPQTNFHDEEIPSNVILKKFKRPSIWLGILVCSFGTIMTLHGSMHAKHL